MNLPRILRRKKEQPKKENTSIGFAEVKGKQPLYETKLLQPNIIKAPALIPRLAREKLGREPKDPVEEAMASGAPFNKRRDHYATVVAREYTNFGNSIPTEEFVEKVNKLIEEDKKREEQTKLKKKK
jgi:hypothetical protein